MNIPVRLRALRYGVVAVLPLLLAGCVDDGVAMHIDGTQHALSLLRQQKRFWEKTADLEIVVARLPDCQRRYHLQPAPVGPGFKVEVYATGPRNFILAERNNLYAVETQSCEQFARLDVPPADGMGDLVGAFREEHGKLVFVAAQAAPGAAGAGGGAAAQ